MKEFYITTPIYYVNDKPHIGHAYTTIAADVCARWKRMKGEKVFFLTGTDEHGSKIAQAAEKNGSSCQDYVNQLAGEFKDLWTVLNISNDDFIRTTEPRHVRTVQTVFKTLHEKGIIVQGFYEDWYCVSCESFWLENELIDGNCPDCGRKVEKLKEESYFFNLSRYEKKLLDHYKDHPEFLSPKTRSQEIVNFVRSGLKDLSVSRLKEKWGIPVVFNPQHTTYVWFDALLNYLSAVGYEGTEVGEGRSSDLFGRVWPANIHFVGKEIFRFHGVIWPAMLLALGVPLPEKVFAHGWWTVEGEKMSKSKGNIVDPKNIVQDFGVDGFRYFILREMPFGMDGDFSRKSLLARYNAELANNLGNLFSRTVTLIEKNFGGKVQCMPDGVLADKMKEESRGIEQAYEKISYHEVLERCGSVVTEANRYIDQKTPWSLVKTDLKAAEKVLAECLVVLRWLSAAYHPFMPDSSARMVQCIGENVDLKKGGWEIFKNPLARFTPGNQVRRGAVLFPRKDR